ncbi:MAG: hypothetical protein JRI22_06515 [Deltaproteobacteria bacterium]|nr:hypothetical protein [Deltaproteobacteria bacterium]
MKNSSWNIVHRRIFGCNQPVALSLVAMARKKAFMEGVMKRALTCWLFR